MTQADDSIVTPLSADEARVLRAYVEQDGPWLAETVVAGPVASLKARGFLQSHERGMLVTPEGLAAALG
jgi:hypothetical protein